MEGETEEEVEEVGAKVAAGMVERMAVAMEEAEWEEAAMEEAATEEVAMEEDNLATVEVATEEVVQVVAGMELGKLVASWVRATSVQVDSAQETPVAAVMVVADWVGVEKVGEESGEEAKAECMSH